MPRSLPSRARREFLIKSSALGGAFMVGVYLPTASYAAPGEAAEVTHWVLIYPDDSVVVRVARSEVGQGSYTGLVQLVVEELEADWSKVRAEYADVNEHVKRNRIWGAMSTGGSRAIRDSQEYLRKAGAAAREMLTAAAAQKLGVPVAELSVAKGVITHKASGRSVTFGQVADAAARLEMPKEPKLKDPKDWKIVGQSLPRFDIPEKVSGATIYAADVRVVGLLHASIAQCPVFGGKLKSYDEAKIKAMRGVKKVVATETWVAVVADNWWRANSALKALPIEWDFGKHASESTDSILKFLRSGIDATKDVPTARKDGDFDKAIAQAAKVVEAEYQAPYLNHATMEPQTATARYTPEKLEVWVGTQNGEASIAAASEEAGVALEKVHVYKMHGGGGFGRRGGLQDFTRQAVSVAMALPGVPVRLQWSREEDMQHGRYRPMAIVRMRGGLDKDGNWIAWHIRQSESSVAVSALPQLFKDGIDQIGVRAFQDAPYAVPNFTHEYAMRNAHVPLGPWRAVAHTHNPFMRECFIDELAHAAGKDPYQFRRPLLAKKPKDLAVLDAVAKAINWNSPPAAGVHRGIAVQDSYGSFTAAAVQLSVKDNVIDVHRVVVSVDSGYVVNPNAVEAQIESGVIWGLSALMHEEITIKDGRVEQSNFADYPVLRLAHTPKIESVIVPSGGFWGGVGEPPIAAVLPAMGNALFAATGKRIRSMPFKNHGFSYG